MISILLVFVIIAIGVTAYLLGVSVGKEDGYDEGYMAGWDASTTKWTDVVTREKS